MITMMMMMIAMAARTLDNDAIESTFASIMWLCESGAKGRI